MVANDTNFQLGQLTSEISGLNTRFDHLYDMTSSIDERLRLLEKNVTALSVKMAILGIVAGGVGSTIVSLLVRRLSYGN